MIIFCTVSSELICAHIMYPNIFIYSGQTVKALIKTLFIFVAINFVEKLVLKVCNTEMEISFI